MADSLVYAMALIQNYNKVKKLLKKAVPIAGQEEQVKELSCPNCKELAYLPRQC